MAVMLDLETLSTRPDAHILSIGAVEFDVKTGRLGQSFYYLINNDGWAEHFHIDSETVRWWFAQSAESRGLIARPERKSLPEALVHFQAFMRQCGEDSEVWGNGSDFDNVILRHAYTVLKMPLPWRYTANRCFRTLRALYNPALPEPTTAELVAQRGGTLPAHLPAEIFTAHSALGDAISQVRSLMSVYGHAL